MRRGLALGLAGNFRLDDGNGTEVPIRMARVRALLALLATSRDRKRTRAWLQSCLWERSPEEQASGSLRQALSALRRALGDHADLLETDRTYVSMPDLDLVPVAAGVTFFEDAPELGDMFEDWLRMERASRDGAPAIAANGAIETARCCVIMGSPQVMASDPMMTVLAALVCDRVLDGLRAYGMIDLFDLRDLSSNQLGLFPTDAPPRADAVFQLRAVELGGDRHVTTSLVEPQSQRVLWTQTRSLESLGDGMPPTIEWLQEITGLAVEAVPRTLFRQDMAAGQNASVPQGRGLFAATHQILGMSMGGQERARALLRRHLERSGGTAIGHAWYAFSFANSVGENSDDAANDMLGEAAQHCAYALEREPSNGLVLILAAHVYGFVLRRQNAAAELAKLARQAAPDLPLVWDLSAMNAIYRDDAETGHGYSLVAQRLGQFSPYKPLYDSSVSISATLTGRHALAVETAEALLQRRSGFLAAMRYLSVSLVAEGRIEDARQVVADVRARDPDFRIETIRSHDYPLPSETSRQVIEAALAKL